METKITAPKIGLNLDALVEEQSNQEISFGLNGILENVEGDIYNYQNEPGNVLCQELDSTIVGSINLERDSFILFTSNEISSYIFKFENKKLTLLVEDEQLNFDSLNPIKGLYEIVKGCETVIYWYDYSNPDRWLNLDKLDSFKDGSGDWDLQKMILQPVVSLPYVSTTSVLPSGGNLDLGLYHFAVGLLDENLNEIKTSLISQNPIQIYDENINSIYDTIDGGTNLINDPVNGLPQTNKSIRVLVENIDTNYSFIKLYAIKKTSGNGFGIEVFSNTSFKTITGNTMSLIYTGEDSSSVREDLDKLLTKQVFYESSKDMSFVDRRLVRINLKGKNVDYSNFQRAANKIKAGVVVEQVDCNNQFEEYNSKNPNKFSCFQSDEVYSFGIVYVFDDGMLSPPFHIPGMQAIGDEKSLLIIGTDIEATQVQHIPPPNGIQWVNGDTIEKWKVFNTSNIIAPKNFRWAYYECEDIYPETKDCKGEYIYGDLVGTPIRHHRFPDRHEIPLYDVLDFFVNDHGYEKDKLNLFGVEFDSTTIEYPHPDIIGHYFVVGRRTPDTQTVVESGYFNGENAWFSPYNGSVIDTNRGRFLSLSSLFLNQYLNGSHFQHNYSIRINNTEIEEPDPEISTNTAKTIIYDGKKIKAEDHIFFWRENYLIVDNVFLDSGNKYIDSNANDVVSLSLNNIVNYYNLDSDVEVFGIQSTGVIGTNPIPLTSAFVYNKRYLSNAYCDLQGIEYHPLHGDVKNLNSDQAIIANDTFVSFVKLFDVPGTPESAATNGSGPGNLFILPFESRINGSMRYGGQLVEFQYFKTGSITEYTFNKRIDPDNNSSLPLPEWYGYNQDYSFIRNPETFIPLPLNYDYCNKCENIEPNKVIWSERNFPEESNINHRIFLSENSTVVGENTGELTNIHYDKNRILLTSRQSIFQLAPNPQVLQTDLDSAYLGTGDFLSIPPNELFNTDYGYGGNQGILNAISTEFGWITIDQKAGQIFLFNNGLEELSSKKYKCQKWFRKNLPEKLYELIPEYPQMDSTIEGIGLKTVFDPYYKRLILHKASFLPINYGGIYNSNSLTQEGKVYYDVENHIFLTKENGIIKEISIYDSDYFEDKSWTLSFSFDYMQWSSFHSYLPEWSMNDSKTFYTIEKDIYEHVHDNFTNYYGKQLPFIIESVVNNMTSFKPESIGFYSKTLLWNEELQQWEDIDFPTFNQAMVYSDRESTGTFNLIPKEDNYPAILNWNNQDKNISLHREYYTINSLRNIGVNSPLNSSNWEQIKGDYFIDKVQYLPNIDFDKSQWEITPLKDRAFKVRFIFRNFYDKDYKLIININTININNNKK